MTAARFEEEMPYEVGFSKIYDRDIVPKLQKINADRLHAIERSKKRKLVSALLLGTALAFSVISLFVYFDFTNTDVLIFWGVLNLVFGVIAIVTAAIICNMPLQGFTDELKDFLIDIICRFFGGMSYTRDGDNVVDLKRFNDLGLIEKSTDGSMTDALQGEIDGTRFRWVEAVTKHSSRSSRSGKPSTSRTVFTGCLLAVAVSDPFRGEVLISSRRFAPETNRVEIEHPRFHDTFKIIAEDASEARRLVTHDFADKMLTIARHYGSGRVMAAFQGGEFLLSIETDIDRFEQINADTPPEEIPTVMHHILGDIQHVRELVGTIVH